MNENPSLLEAKPRSSQTNSSPETSTRQQAKPSTQKTRGIGRKGWRLRRASSDARDRRDRGTVANLHWLAGLIDGEGNFSAYRDLRHTEGYSYFLRVSITNCDRRTLTLIQQKYGGSLGEHKAGKKGDGKGWRQSWRWTLSGDDAYDLVKQLASCLVIKGRVAEIWMLLYEYKDEMKKLARQKTLAHYYFRIRRLNQRGNRQQTKIA